MRAVEVNVRDLPELHYTERFVDYSERARDFLGYHYERIMGRLRGVRDEIYDRVSRAVDYFVKGDGLDRAREMVEKTSTIISDDRVYRITEPDGIRKAGLTMRRYLLANPDFLEMYKRSRIAGWDRVVHVPERDEDPRWREDYINVIDGVIFHEYDEEGHMVVRRSILENPLSSTEQLNVIEAWEMMKALLAQGIDPTVLGDEDEE